MKQFIIALLLLSSLIMFLTAQETAEVYLGNPQGSPESDVGSLTPIPIDFYHAICQHIYWEEMIVDAAGEPVYGLIDNLTLYYGAANAQSQPAKPNTPVKLYLATTNIREFPAGAPDENTWIPADQFTLVFDGLVNFPATTSGRVAIQFPLSTQYMYLGGNLVLMTVSNARTMVGSQMSNSSPGAGFNPTVFAPYIVEQVEDIDPIANGYPIRSEVYPNIVEWYNLDRWRGNMLVHFSERIAGDYNLIASSIGGQQWQNINQNVNIEVVVTNGGNADVLGSAYSVKLLLQDNTQLNVIPGVSLIPGQSHTFTLSTSFPQAGTYYVYGVIDHPADEIPGNLATGLWEVRVHPFGISETFVGDPESPTLHPVPFDFIGYYNSLTQTIYRGEDIDMTGVIHNIIYDFNGGHPIPNKPIKIWMANTPIQSYATGAIWVPYNSFTLVYEGLFDHSTYGKYNYEIVLDTPFNFTGPNLVIMANRVWNDQDVQHSNQNQFVSHSYITPRTLYASQNGTESNQYNPAIGYPNTATQLNIAPNIRFILKLTTTVSGSVIDAETGDDIEDAIVTLTSEQGSFTEETEADGSFILEGVTAYTTYTLTVTKAGYEPYETEIEVGDEPITIDTPISLVPIIYLPPTNVVATSVYEDAAEYILVSWTAPDYQANPIARPVIPELLGYDVYVANIAHIETPALWESIVYVTTLTHQIDDAVWEDLPFGDYKYIVIAVYEDNFRSAPAFSNTIDKSPIVHLPVTDVVAEIVGEYDDAHIVLNWIAPDYGASPTARPVIPELVGYDIYVALEANVENPSAWTEVSLNVTATTYTDNTIWTGLVAGNYKYIVVAVYVFNMRSTPTTSNTVVKVPTSEVEIEIPTRTALTGNYPNPFNPYTTIAFDLAKDASVTMEIFNIKGQKVINLWDAQMRAGKHTLVWDGKDDTGRNATSGIYFYRLKADDYVETRKMILMK